MDISARGCAENPRVLKLVVTRAFPWKHRQPGGLRLTFAPWVSEEHTAHKGAGKMPCAEAKLISARKNYLCQIIV
jgi:hypothetical protein